LQIAKGWEEGHFSTEREKDVMVPDDFLFELVKIKSAKKLTRLFLRD